MLVCGMATALAWASASVAAPQAAKGPVEFVRTHEAGGQEIAVYLDDAAPAVNGWCATNYLTIGNPVTIQ
jgi:hypothetical protein